MTKHYLYYSKTCVLCENKTRNGYELCRNCYELYKGYKDEVWFKELRKLQHIQNTIDNKEVFSYVYSNMSSKDNIKNRGRPQTDWRIVEDILKIFDNALETEKISLRAIVRKLNNKVGYITVRSILIRYRAKEYRSKNKA